MYEVEYRVVAIPIKNSPYETTMTFKDIQIFVGDYVERIHLYDDIYAMVDENAKMKTTTEPNRTVVLQEKTVFPLTIFNNFVLVKCTEKSEMVNLNDAEVKEALFIFRNTSEPLLLNQRL